MILPASLVASVLIYLARRILPTSLARACDFGSSVLIHLKGRVIMLIKRSMVQSHAFLLFSSSCLLDFKAKAKGQRSKAKRSLSFSALLPSGSKMRDPALLAASRFQPTNAHKQTQSSTKREKQQNANKQGAQVPHTVMAIQNKW